ncbi:MAG: hypothetical protein Q9224_000368 [Gallowayella concinna]
MLVSGIAAWVQSALVRAYLGEVGALAYGGDDSRDPRSSKIGGVHVLQGLQRPNTLGNNISNNIFHDATDLSWRFAPLRTGLENFPSITSQQRIAAINWQRDSVNHALPDQESNG